MDSNLECPVCLIIYSSIRRPKSLNCGHSICISCLEDILSTKSHLCPLCVEPIKNPESLPFNWFILERVSYLEVNCDKHQNCLGTHFNVKTISSVCSNCFNDHDAQDLIDLSCVDLATYIIQKAIDIEVSNSDKILPQVRAKVRQIPMKSNKDKIKILKELVESIESAKCEQHFSEAIFIDVLSGKLLCVQCPRMGKELSISDPDAKVMLKQRIHELSNSIDYFCIPYNIREFIKQIFKLSLNELVMILVTLSKTTAYNSPRLISATCIVCNQEFSYQNNLPCKLPCRSTHLICELCSKRTSVCPLDNNPCNSSDLLKIIPKIALCPNCQEPYDSDRLPILLPCGVVKCRHCIFNEDCNFCKSKHINITCETQNISKFFLQISEFFHVRCAIDGKTAQAFDSNEMKPFCHQCSQKRPTEKIENIDLGLILSRECNRKANELGAKVTPVLSKQLMEIKNLSNTKKIELLNILVKISSPETNFVKQITQGFPVPDLPRQSHYFQRFNSILPNPLVQSNIKAWFINKKENQIETVCFKSSRTIRLIGVTITCPLNNEEGFIEYLDIIQGNKINGKRELRTLVRQKLKGIVLDFFFDAPFDVKELDYYVLVFKIDANNVYKGNPLDKGEFRGSDGTEFEICEATQKGYFTNGQGHLSGPLIRLIYE
jgi:Zinc finger, C3HC4 type (RING finger)